MRQSCMDKLSFELQQNTDIKSFFHFDATCTKHVIKILGILHPPLKQLVFSLVSKNSGGSKIMVIRRFSSFESHLNLK